MKIALVVPHIFMWDKIRKDSIFAPGDIAVAIADGLVNKGHQVTLFSSGPVKTKASNNTVRLESIQKELKKYDENLAELIKKDHQTFRRLFKIIELEILSNAFQKENKFDLIHVFVTNGPEGPLFSRTINKPVIFTLHDPFKLNFPNSESYQLINNVKFTAISDNQRLHAKKLNVIKTIYNGINFGKFKFNLRTKDYFLSYGRIIRPKGVHHAISVCHDTSSRLKIAGLHYEGHGGDNYWSKEIRPHIDNKLTSYEGYIENQKEKNLIFGNAKALLFPIEWDEPFGLVMIEANACGTPVIAFNHGSVAEIVKDGVNGYIVENKEEMKKAMKKIEKIDRKKCSEYAKKRFDQKIMLDKYESLYERIVNS